MRVPETAAVFLLLALTLTGCIGGVSEKSDEDGPEQISDSEIEQVVEEEGPGTVLAWELRSFSISEDGLLEDGEGISGVQIAGTPSPLDIRATAEEALKELRAEFGYRGLELSIYSEPMEAFPDRGFYLGSMRDSPFGLELDRIDEVNFEGFEDHFVEIVAWKADWTNIPSATDYTIWLAYNQALSENPIDLDAGDVDGQRETRERRALISVSSDFDIDDELVLAGFTRFNNFKEDYETYEFQIAEN